MAKKNIGKNVLYIFLSIYLLIGYFTAITIVMPKGYIKYVKLYDISHQPFYQFEEDLQLVDLHVSSNHNFGRDTLFYSLEKYTTITEVYFSIQGHNRPLKKDEGFIVTKVVLFNDTETISDTKEVKVEFSNRWEFDYTNNIRPDFVDKDVKIRSFSGTSIPGIKLASIRTNDDSLGSYFYVFEFADELKNTSEFNINIHYISKYNSEEKVISLNVKHKRSRIVKETAWEREMRRR